MAGVILEIINNSSIAEVYAKNARERALKRHDKATIISGLIHTHIQKSLKRNNESKNSNEFQSFFHLFCLCKQMVNVN
jgi:hypothetical protein